MFDIRLGLLQSIKIMNSRFESTYVVIGDCAKEGTKLVFAPTNVLY